MAISGSLQVPLERAMCEAMGVKLKLKRRPQDIGDARNMECLLKKIIGNEWSQPRKVTMRLQNGKTIGVGLPRPISTHTMVLCASNARHKAIGFNIYHTEF
jgi:hypothetical protein